MLAGWGESGRIGLRNVHIWAPPPYLLPNLIVQSNEPNPLPGSFAFIENYSELTLRLGRICKWANLTKKNASSSAGAHFPPRLLCHSSARQPRAVSSVPPGPPGRKEGSVDATLGNETPLKDTAGYHPTCPVTASYNRTLHSPLLIVATSLYHTMAHATRLYIAMYGIIYHNTHCTSCLLEEQLSEMYET